MRKILEAIGAALARILGLATLPFRMLSGFFGGGSGGSGPQAAEATVQSEEQVRAAAEEAEKSLALQQVARLLMQVAKRRVDDRDVSDLADALPADYSRFVCRLTKSECLKLSETDGRTILSWVQGKRPSLPGIRSIDEVLVDAAPSRPAPAPSFTASRPQPVCQSAPQPVQTQPMQSPAAVGAEAYTPAENAVRNALAARLLAHGRQPRAADDEPEYGVSAAMRR